MSQIPQQFSKQFHTHFLLWTSGHSGEVSVLIPTLQMKKLRHKEARCPQLVDNEAGTQIEASSTHIYWETPCYQVMGKGVQECER